jgi:hypothetical protein
VTENSNSTLREVVELSVSHESIRTILANHLGMKHVAARLVRRPEFSPTINRMRVAEKHARTSQFRANIPETHCYW